MFRGILDKILGGVLGTPCSRAQPGHGSFLTLDFGALDAENHGEWHLWIYCCYWQITQTGHIFADSESTHDAIQSACSLFVGHSLTHFGIEDEHGVSRLTFASGAELVTQPYDADHLEQWMLFGPNEEVLTYRADGAFSYGQANSSEERFERITRS